MNLFQLLHKVYLAGYQSIQGNQQSKFKMTNQKKKVKNEPKHLNRAIRFWQIYTYFCGSLEKRFFDLWFNSLKVVPMPGICNYG